MWSKGDYHQAQTVLTEALQLSRERNDNQGIAEALMLLPLLNVACGEVALAWTQAEEGVALFLKGGDDMSYTISRVVLGWVAASQQDFAKARLLLVDVIAHSRERNYLFNLAHGLPLLGLVTLWQGDTATAEAYFKECLQLPQQHFYQSFMALSLGGLGAIALRLGNVVQTYSLLEQCRVMDKELTKPSNVATYLMGLAAAVAALGELPRAARLLGVLETMCEVTQVVVPLPCLSTRIFTLVALRTRMDEEAYRALEAEGQLMTLEQVLEM